jgi:hypothetical protein
VAANMPCVAFAPTNNATSAPSVAFKLTDKFPGLFSWEVGKSLSGDHVGRERPRRAAIYIPFSEYDNLEYDSDERSE